MLNGRLYFHAWLIAIVALLVAFLTLQPEETPIDAEQAPSFDAARAERLASDLVAAAAERPPGSPQAAASVEAQFPRPSRWQSRGHAESAGPSRRAVDHHHQRLFHGAGPGADEIHPQYPGHRPARRPSWLERGRPQHRHARRDGPSGHTGLLPPPHYFPLRRRRDVREMPGPAGTSTVCRHRGSRE